MPELPEVETLCSQLQKRIIGKRILETEIYDVKLGRMANPAGLVIQAVRRRGKSIVLLLENKHQVVIHLRMTGRLFWRQEETHEPHTRWRMVLDNASIDLIDPRRFATVRYEVSSEEQGKKDLITGFDQKEFLKKQAKRRVKVKDLLMDQKAIVGIGNIYACEILHSAYISPLRQAGSLTKEEWRRVFVKARSILKKAISKRGTSVSDWRDLYGCRGENQKELKVYGREGECCFTCGTKITRVKQGGRSTFYCRGCQKIDKK